MPTDSHQYLEAYLCHSFHCKREMFYSQALLLNHIRSNNEYLIREATIFKVFINKEVTDQIWYERK